MTTFLYFYELTTYQTEGIDWKDTDNPKPVVELTLGLIDNVTPEQVNYLREIIVNS